MAIVPVAERYDPETDQMEFVLSPDDYERIRQGYGCSHCLCDYHGILLMKCPDCGSETFVAADVPRGDYSFKVVKK